MSRGKIAGRVGALLAVLALVLATDGPASAEPFHGPGRCLKFCSPCFHPYYGYYPTCWRPWPPGWNSWNCGRMLAHPMPSAELIPGQPRRLNGEKPELKPEPKPELKPEPPGVSQLPGGRPPLRITKYE